MKSIHSLASKLFPIFAILIVGCGQERLAGGGTDQPNTFSGIVKMTDGSLAVNARVHLRPGIFNPDTNMAMAWNGKPTLDETVTDINGKFTVKNLPGVNRFLDIVSKDSQSVSIRPIFTQDLENINGKNILLRNAGYLAGKFKSNPGNLFSVNLSGTGYQALIKEDGSFRFPPLVPGNYTLTARSNLDTRPGYFVMDSIKVLEGETTFLDTLKMISDSISLYNFEKGNVRSGLRGLVYPKDNNEDGRILIEETIIDTILFDTEKRGEVNLTNENAYQGTCIRIKPTVKRKVRFQLGKGFYDFSHVKGFSFYAKSIGDSTLVSVGFSSKTVLPGGGSFISNIILEKDWKRYIILPEMILAVGEVANKGITWGNVRSEIDRITFYVPVGMEVWIDDIHLLGSSYGNLLEQEVE